MDRAQGVQYRWIAAKLQQQLLGWFLVKPATHEDDARGQRPAVVEAPQGLLDARLQTPIAQRSDAHWGILRGHEKIRLHLARHHL